MKKTIVYSLLIAAMAAGTLGSCSRGGNPEPADKGKAYLSLSVEEDLLPSVSVTRGGGIDYTIRVIDASQAVVHTCDESDLDQPIELLPGHYTVEAFNCQEQEAVFDAPYYCGSTTVFLGDGETKNASITCALGGVKVSVACSEQIKQNFDYSIEVTGCEPDVPSAVPLLFDGSTEESAGYFRCSGALTYKVTLTNSSGYPFVFTSTVRDVEPNQHYSFSFRIGEGQPGEEVIVDDSMREFERIIDLLLDRKAPPSFDAPGHDLGGPIFFTAGSAPVFAVEVSAPAYINAVTISHSSTQFAAAGVPYNFSPITATEAQRQAIAGELTWTDIEDVVSATIDFSGLLATLDSEGEHSVEIAVQDHQAQTTVLQINFSVSYTAPEVATGYADPWAKFATISGEWLTEARPEGIGMMYRKQGEPDWIAATGTPAAGAGKSYSMRITGLDPNTVYEYMAVSELTDKTAVRTFATERADQLYNMGFDLWNGNSANASGDATFWDSANPGGPITTTREASYVRSGSAARLESVTYIGQFAAGNIYTGNFGSITIIPMGAKLKFGQRYTCQPTTFSGWYDYRPKTINKGSAASGPDKCNIWVLLADWSAQFDINTGAGTFIDIENDPGIIAYGGLSEAECSATSPSGQYVPFTVKLDYRSTTRTPKYVVLVATSSRYGDYFTGGEGSVLYIDDFEFGFDPVD